MFSDHSSNHIHTRKPLWEVPSLIMIESHWYPSTCSSVNFELQFTKSLHRRTRCEQHQLRFANIKLTDNQKRLPTQATLFKERQNITSKLISFLLLIILDTWYSSPRQWSPHEVQNYSFLDVRIRKVFLSVSSWINFYLIVFGRCRVSWFLSDGWSWYKLQQRGSYIMYNVCQCDGSQTIRDNECWQQQQQQRDSCCKFLHLKSSNWRVAGVQTVYKRTVASEQCGRTSFRPGDS